MPTIDRRPRRRVRPPVEAKALDYQTLLERARAADRAAWDSGLRRDLVRCLADRGMKPDEAAAVAAAFERKPMYIPAAPPSNAKGPDL